ncbi:MAG: aminotransferase class V-fold PLP-dependent enzyme [Coriobacteriia bacterium]|nr:aminotransferase class V-fold PLP-dependent enzyme [Coriobacteriia bacterium]
MSETDGTEGKPTTIYLDHGATSWPKPPGVSDAVASALIRHGGNPDRGTYQMAVETARAVRSARGGIASLLGVSSAKDLVFQPGCTQAMNLVLAGLLSAGDRVVVGFSEHNAVARPLHRLAQRGVEVVAVSATPSGIVDVDEMEREVRRAPTRAVICQHTSNLSGAIQPVADLTDIAHENDAIMIVDGAQAGGHIPVDLSALGVDAWGCSGHKGLLGPQGIGVLYLREGCEPDELVVGGTGAGMSEEPLQPKVRPERYEAGTMNTPGILGLGAAAHWLAEHGSAQRGLEEALTRRLHEGILGIDGFTVLGPKPGEPRVPIISAVHESEDTGRIAFLLDRQYGIACRAGLHCAPWAHRAFGTLKSGALRFGIGYGNTSEDIDCTLDALRRIVGGLE